MRKILDLKDIKNVVIFRTDRIGEVLLSTPVIEAIREYLPDAKIDFVTSDYAADIVSGRSDLNDLIRFSTINKKFSIQGVFKLVSVLKKRGFDLAVILNPHKLIHLGCFLAGIRYRAGVDRKWGFLLTHKVMDKRHLGTMHEVDYNLQVLESIGIRHKSLAPSMYVATEDSDYIEGLFNDLHIETWHKVIAVHPGSSNPAKRWPAENFTALIKRLAVSKDIDVVLIGDESERPLSDSIIKGINSRHIFDLTGRLRLKQLAALLKRATLLITNDTGPMHMAAAVGTKVLAIFGRNIPGVSPRRWGPYGSGHMVFHKELGCKPCFDAKCSKQFKCLRSLMPEQVFEAAMRML